MSLDLDPERRMQFVLDMRRAGLTDSRALAALERTPRTHYAPAHLEELALDDVELPLPHGQIMTRPSLVGRMIAALDVPPDGSVLEIGTGSGFQTGALASISKRVITVERWRALAVIARENLGRARLMNVHVHVGDGVAGWAEDAPFDRIVVNAACAHIPPGLVAQLVPGGALLLPLGAGETQRLTRIGAEGARDLGAIKFDALAAGVAGD